MIERPLSEVQNRSLEGDFLGFRSIEDSPEHRLREESPTILHEVFDRHNTVEVIPCFIIEDEVIIIFRTRLALDISLETIFSSIVRGGGECPVFIEESMECEYMGCSDSSGFLEMIALIDLTIDSETITLRCLWHELPESTSSGTTLGSDIESTLSYGEVFEIIMHSDITKI